MNPVKQINVLDLMARLAAEPSAEPSIVMIDVREQEEVIHGIIPGAKHIPMNDIPARIEELQEHEEIIFICRSGYRSERVCEYLLQQGYNGGVNLEGGMLAWMNAEGPIV
ncbi:rhodanese-like domain-containing protein [Paenibacillus marinisediminis]